MWSVVITCYNYAHYLEKAIDSVRSQYQDTKIIVVNDASTDNTREICDKYNDIYVIHNRKNMGVAESRNLGAELFKSKYLLFLDADDYIGEGFLSRAEEVLKFADIARPNIHLIRESGTVLWHEDKFSVEDFYNYSKASITCPMKYEVWNNTKFKTRSVYEDYDFWIEAVKSGYKFANMNRNFYCNLHGKGRSSIPQIEYKRACSQLARIHNAKIQGTEGNEYPSNPRVSIITPYLSMGGVEVWLINLIKYSKLNWVGVCVTKDRRYKLYEKELERLGVPIYTDPKEMIENSDFVICANDDLEFPINKEKLICVSHGSGKWTKDKLDKVKDKCKYWAAVGQACTKPYGQGEIRVIQNGVDPSHTLPSVNKKEVRAKWNIPEDAKVACYWGRFSPEKNLQELINAAGDYYVVLVGTFPEGSTDSYEVNDYTRIISPYERIGEFIEGVDVFVLPSLDEGNCLALLEAMMHIPCLVTNVGAVEELGIDQFNLLPSNPTSEDIKTGLLNIKDKPRKFYTAMKMAYEWDQYIREIHAKNYIHELPN